MPLPQTLYYEICQKKQLHGCSTEANLMLNLGGQLCICAIQSAFFASLLLTSVCNPDDVILRCESTKTSFSFHKPDPYDWQIAKETFDNFGDMWRYLVNDVIQVVASDTCSLLR